MRRLAVCPHAVLALAGAIWFGFTPTAHPQHRTNECETVLVFGTGLDAAGLPLRGGSIDPHFHGVSVNFTNAPNAYVVTIVPGAWLSNSASAASQWIAPGPDPNYPAGTYHYQLTFVTPCAHARVDGRFAAGDRGAVQANGAGAFVSTPTVGYSNWTSFAFSGLPAGTNRLDFFVTNAPSALGPPGPTGLRAELEVTATCCACLELECPADMLVTTCSNSALVNYTVTGTNHCASDLFITCVPPSGNDAAEGESCEAINDCETMQQCSLEESVCRFICFLEENSQPPGFGGCLVGQRCEPAPDIGLDGLGICTE